MIEKREEYAIKYQDFLEEREIYFFGGILGTYFTNHDFLGA